MRNLLSVLRKEESLGSSRKRKPKNPLEIEAFELLNTERKLSVRKLI